MGKYKYILWDVDGTLLDFDYSQKISLFKCLKQIGVEGTDELNEKYSAINHKWWKNLELGLVTKDELLNGRFTEFFDTVQINCPDVEAFRKQYQYELGVNFCPVEHALEVCEHLKELGFLQFVVTNGVSSTQRTKLSLSGIDALMEGVFISEELGNPKPNKAFFDACFKQISLNNDDFNPELCLIIGDSMSSDMVGGQNAGIDTCYFAPNAEEKEESVTYQIKKLTDVYGVLGVR